MADVIQRVQSYTVPAFIIGLSSYYTLTTAVNLLLTSPSKITTLREATFSRFWNVYGKSFNEKDDEFVKQVVSTAEGVVADIGPGTGLTIKFFDKSKVKKIYGVEPNPGMHEGLKKSIIDAGLEDIYEIVGTGVEDVETLAKHGITPGSIDTVCCIKVLCGVPTPDIIAGQLYKWLRPGGQLIVFEHVVQKKDTITKLFQRFFNIFWPYLLGGCELCRDTQSMLLGAGEWEGELGTVKYLEKEPRHEIIPHIMGKLVKKETSVVVG